ncbi:hypothetical protein AVEN_212113-1 [Araneus ventricosus]|uniref:Endonuclease/exonuclease/phosphatase domain-containing protein n=1 Tax=Araneus ventricosus TaxID=182803 RepID=A0A4Y2TZE9_ARAVE|nr:hypothetical protein AVEN_212113-1 [Araneus ventricosus]
MSCLAASMWREGGTGRNGGSTSGVFSPGRDTLGVKVIPLCSANAWQALEQSKTSTFGCSRYLVPTVASHSLLLTMLGSPVDSNTASSVAWVNKRRVRGLGRGPRTERLLQSPNGLKCVKPLRIIQCNINGLCTSATRERLDQILELADHHKVQIIALQETKLKPTFQLKIKGYHILLKDRLNKGGGGLLFLVRHVNYNVINLDQSQSDSDLEIQGEALDVSIVSSDVSSKYRWDVLDNIGSDHLPLLIEYNSLLRSCDTRRNFLNFKKANWELYRSVITESIEQTTFPDELEQNYLCFRGIILKSAMAAIAMGNIKNYQPNYTHNLPIVKPLIIKRNILSRELLLNDNNSTRTELNRINAEIKRVYAYHRRKRWIEICQGIDVRTPDTKLWKLPKAFNKEQPQIEKTNCVFTVDCYLPFNDRVSADVLRKHDCRESELDFTRVVKNIAVKARKLAQRCRNVKSVNPFFDVLLYVRNLKQL